MRTRAAGAVCAALLLFSVAGCGSDDDTSTSAATATTQSPLPTTSGTTTTSTTSTTATEKQAKAAHEAFIKRVNPICEDYNKTVQSVQNDLKAVGKTGNVDVYAAPLARATKAAQRASDRFNALTPPKAEVQQAALIGRALKAQATGNDLLLEAARADDPTDFAAATQALRQVTPKLQELMRSYGMTVCGAAG